MHQFVGSNFFRMAVPLVVVAFALVAHADDQSWFSPLAKQKNQLEEVEKAIGNRPSPQNVPSLAPLLVANGRVRDLDRILADCADAIECQMMRAILFSLTTRAEQALSANRAVLPKMKSSEAYQQAPAQLSVMHFQAAQALFALGDFDASVKEADTALRYAPSELAVVFRRFALLYAGKYTEACESKLDASLPLELVLEARCAFAANSASGRSKIAAANATLEQTLRTQPGSHPYELFFYIGGKKLLAEKVPAAALADAERFFLATEPPFPPKR